MCYRCPSALEVLRNRAILIDIYLLYLLTYLRVRVQLLVPDIYLGM